MIDQLEIEPKQSHFLLAISGGIDSVVLFHLLRKNNISFECAHCNFALRDKESDLDQQFVEELCGVHNVGITVKSFETSEYADHHKISIQEAARVLRYEWFETLRRESKADYLLTAHHANDNLETILYNLTKGTRLAGLRGVAQLKETTQRPLLHFTKDDILSYAQKNELKWREDSSNKSNKYSRNLIRNVVVPNLKKINPSIESSIIRFSDHITKADAYLKLKLTEYLSLKTRENLIVLPKEDFRSPEFSFLVELALFEKGFTQNQINNLMLSLSKIGKEFISNEFHLRVERQSVTISKLEKELQFHKEVNQEGRFETPNGEITIKKVPLSNLDLKTSQNIVHIPLTSTTFPIIIRNKKDGDKFKPFGMNGMKKVSDFLIDEKVEMREKRNTLIMESNDMILWIVNQRLDDRFKISKKSKEALRLEFNPK